MTLDKMKEALSLGAIPEYFSNVYPEVKDSYEARSSLILSDSYIENVLTEASALLPYKELIKQAAAKALQNNAMRLLICIMEYKLLSKEKVITPDYTAVRGDGIEYDFLHLFPALSSMPKNVAFFRERGVPEDIIAASMQEYDYSVEYCEKRMGRPVFDAERLAWIFHVINNNLIRIGRFKYEMPCKRVYGVKVYKNKDGEIAVLANDLNVHRTGKILGSAGLEDKDGSFYAQITETDTEISGYPIIDALIKNEPITLKKSEWELSLSPEDDVIPIHIPPFEGFDRDTCEESYARTREIFDTCFPEKKYKAFHCRTWLLSADLCKVLKSGSNILDFQSKFTLYPTISNGTWIFENVYPAQGGLSNLKNLSEDTSLQRNVKQLYLDGGYIHDNSGFFF